MLKKTTVKRADRDLAANIAAMIRGEQILLTEEGRPFARIIPPEKETQPRTTFEAADEVFALFEY